MIKFITFLNLDQILPNIPALVRILNNDKLFKIEKANNENRYFIKKTLLSI